MTADFRRALLGNHIDSLVAEGRAIRVADDLRFGEGPSYLPEQDAWIFSDIPNDRVLRFSEREGLSVLLQPSRFANGHCPMPGGGFLSCEHLSRSVTRTHLDGRLTTVCDAFEGRRLNSPNDVVVGPDGAVWFSDPTYGILGDVEGRRAEREQEHNRVYRVGPDETVTAEIETLAMPNGLAFSPDGRSLYVVDSGADMGPDLGFDPDGARDLLVFPVGPDGRVSGAPRQLYRARQGIPDGIRVDPDGHLWLATGAGIVCLDASGNEVGTLPTPTTASNLSFGGVRGDRLFITTENAAFLALA